jgi:uncharacterized membrane protein YgaE (UPF0421/DUF939 family)
LRSRLDTRQLIVHGGERLRAGFQPVLLASIAAALAWVLAHDVLGHAQPFFAPIAAAISLSTSPIQRSRRIVQLVAGVLLGIGIGEALVALVGTTAVALGLIVLLTFGAALMSGEGVFGEGMMFANQAAASSILVVTLHRAGTGSERVVDALVGGAVALVLGVILFPAHPMRLLTNAERAVLRAAASLLEELTTFIQSGTRPPADWALENGQHIHQLLAGLARARSTARANVRVAPRRFRLRAVVDAEAERTARLDLLANAVLSLMRAATTAEERGEHVGEVLEQAITAVAAALDRLVRASRPWPPAATEAIRATARQIGEDARTRGTEESPVVAAIVRAVAADLEDVVATQAAESTSTRDTAPDAA